MIANKIPSKNNVWPTTLSKNHSLSQNCPFKKWLHRYRQKKSHKASICLRGGGGGWQNSIWTALISPMGFPHWHQFVSKEVSGLCTGTLYNPHYLPRQCFIFQDSIWSFCILLSLTTVLKLKMRSTTTNVVVLISFHSTALMRFVYISIYLNDIT